MKRKIFGEDGDIWNELRRVTTMDWQVVDRPRTHTRCDIQYRRDPNDKWTNAITSVTVEQALQFLMIVLLACQCAKLVEVTELRKWREIETDADREKIVEEIRANRNKDKLDPIQIYRELPQGGREFVQHYRPPKGELEEIKPA